MGFWDATEATAKPLTEENLIAAWKAMRDAPPHPCSLGKHVVNPKALYKPGWYTCGSCGSPVKVTVPLSEL